MNESASEKMRGAGLIVAVCSLLTGLPGCGASPSDNASSLGTRSQTGGLAAPGSSQGVKPLGASRASETQTGSIQGSETTLGANQSATALNGGQDGRDKVPVPGLSAAIAKDLGSPDARVRYRALDHWEAKDSKAPLDPVFEAMEDDDPAVRAKATAIVEQYWAAEQEREKG